MKKLIQKTISKTKIDKAHISETIATTRIAPRGHSLSFNETTGNSLNCRIKTGPNVLTIFIWITLLFFSLGCHSVAAPPKINTSPKNANPALIPIEKCNTKGKIDWKESRSLPITPLVKGWEAIEIFRIISLSHNPISSVSFIENTDLLFLNYLLPNEPLTEIFAPQKDSPPSPPPLIPTQNQAPSEESKTPLIVPFLRVSCVVPQSYLRDFSKSLRAFEEIRALPDTSEPKQKELLIHNLPAWVSQLECQKFCEKIEL